MLLFTWSFALAGRGPDVSCRNLVGAARPHTPGRGVSPPGASDFFDAEKVTKKAPGTPRSPIFCPIGLYQWGNFSATELGFCHLICGGSIDDASASGPVKEIDVSIGACRNMVLTTHPREYPKEFRIGFISAGDSKGGVAPFESSRKRGSRGRNPIERVSPPVRAFAYFSHERKVGRGPGVKPPKLPGTGAEPPKSGVGPSGPT